MLQSPCEIELHSHLPAHTIDQFSELDPAIVTRELVAQRMEEKVFKRELITMLLSIHVQNSGQLLSADKPVSKQFTPITTKSTAAQWI